MPQTYTRTVAWTGANTGAGPNYTWEEVTNSSSGCAAITRTFFLVIICSKSLN